jgi:H+/Na+-translocating ferredoxin:NAD+ oxidoreductase subunit G
MRELIKMIVVLTIISVASGGLLAALREGTQERIDNQVLEFVKGPAVRQVFEGAANDPIASRFQLKDGDALRNFFVGVFDGEAKGLALETSSSKGYKGDIGLIVAVDVKNDKIMGIGVTTHNETPGLGAKSKSDPKFAEQFKGLPASGPVKVTKDGGAINAISGATITSRAVCDAVTDALGTYAKLKPQIVDKMKDIKK